MVHFKITLLILFIMHSSLGLFFIEEPSLGTVAFDDYYYLVGEELKINCSLTDQNEWTSENLYFERRLQTVMNGGIQCMDGSYITRLDADSIAISIPNVTMAYEGSYICKAGNKSCGDDDKVVATTEDDIIIQYGPQKVTNVRCFIYNWNEYMSCSWQHPVPYTNPDPQTLVSVSENGTSLCSGELLEDCHWNKDTFATKDTYTVNITVYNSRKNVFASQITAINRLENVKPAPVENLTVRELQDGCLRLSWNHSAPMEKIFQVVLEINGKPEFPVQSSDLTGSSYEICDVEQYSLYNFCVSCFPSGAKGFWSDSRCASLRPTLLVPPSVGPKLTNNSYVASNCDNGYREIRIYWQRPDVKTKITNYLIKYRGSVLPAEYPTMFTAVFYLDCNSTNIWLEIVAVNEMGQSKSPSVLLILQDLEVPDKVKETFSVDLNMGPKAHWDPDPDNQVTYNLHWCKSDSSVCKDQIYWKTIAWPNTSYIVPNLDDPRYYKYGISISKGDKNSAIYWTDCLFPVKPDMLPEPSVQVDVFETYAKITYGMRCSYQNRITAFLIQYCEAPKCNDSNQVKAYSTPTNVTKYTLEPLLPETFYQIMVRARSDEIDGKRFERRVKTLAIETSVRPTWIIAAVLTPCLCFFIILGAVCSARKCHQSKLKTSYYTQNEEKSYDFQKPSARLCEAYDSNESKATLKVSTHNTTSSDFSKCTVDTSLATYCKVAQGELSKNESGSPHTEQQEAPLPEAPLPEAPGRTTVTEENDPVPADQNLDLHLTQDVNEGQFVVQELNVVQVSCQERSAGQAPVTPPATDDYIRQIL